MNATRRLLRGDAPAGVVRAGTYTLLAKQQLQVVGETGTSSAVAAQRIVIESRLERFRPAEVEFRYPAPGSSANLSRVIPHLVLRNGSWPWERTVEKTKDGRRPWLALLVFAGACPVIQTGGVEALRKVPDRPIADWETDAKCRYIDVPWETFARVAPRLDEISSLLHVQQADGVGVDGTVFTDDLQAVVMARVPVGAVAEGNPVGADGGMQVDVHLVSLEGLADLLPKDDGGPGLEKVAEVRLLSLEHWSFTHRPGDRSTGDLVDRLREVKAGRLRLADNSKLSKEGYVRFEGAEPVLYRGPLLPVTEVDADSVMKLWEDPSDGVRKAPGGAKGIDITYAAAWHMGRLVAMSDAKLGQAFADLREDWRYLDAARQRGFLESELNPVEGERDLEMMQEREDLLGKRIARLWLLEGVPLHYLIPDASMLPVGTLCPFHLDREWADAWMCGAFSAGSHSPSDFNLGYRDGLRMLVGAGQAAWREGEVTGFVLRSPVVPSVPSLRVRLSCIGTDGKETAIPEEKILRLEKIAPDVLLCMVSGGFNRLCIGLPPEAEHYESADGTPAAARESGRPWPSGTDTADKRRRTSTTAEFEVER